MKNLLLASLFPFTVALFGCSGGGYAPSSSSTPNASNPVSGPRFQHVLVVVLENQDYATVSNSGAMPYLNSLARQYGLATQYYANTHPSIGNYFMMTTGQIITNDDAFTGSVADDNVARALASAGKSWKVYAQSLPAAGYVGGDVYPYIKHHNPFAYFSEVAGTSASANIVPLSGLSSDVAAGSLPNFGFVVPDNQHNSHDCPAGMTTCTNDQKLTAADQWLQGTLSPIIASSTFMNSGLVVITFDESATDNANGGGRVVAVFVGGKVKPVFSSSSLYQHQNLLSLVLRQLGVSNAPGAAANAGGMDEFFQ